MNDAIAHRGPDGDGVWTDERAGIALAQRRLAIVDLTETGAQPMVSSCGRYVMVYNGEIYNAADIASTLGDRKDRLKGTSDTEVILESFAGKGIEPTVRSMIGMFAIALWDRDTRDLTLIRDRVGIKPLYWCKTNKTLLFGSELKSIKQHPDCPRDLDHTAIAGYIRKCYVNAPKTIYQGVNQLMPGHILTITDDGEEQLQQYWSMHETAVHGSSHPDQRTETVLLQELEALLNDSVKRRMIADVPLGAFLSGGIDSSLVVALMQQNSHQPVRTFSIGFEEQAYNEAQYAAQVARHLGTDHTELYVTAKDALDVIPSLHTMFDEPFADSSQIPTYLISKMTRKHVTVALSGDGGDELFTGYRRYFSTAKYHRLMSQPQWLRHVEACCIENIPEKILTQGARFLPNRIGKLLHSQNLQRLPSILRSDHPLALYPGTLWHEEDPGQILVNQHTPNETVWNRAKSIKFDGRYSAMQYIDTQDYLTDDILTKVDRASMAASLEARVPLLDHRVIELAWQLPEHMKVRNGQGKWALRRILSKHIPPSLIERPKMGFGVPIDSWLRGPLKDWAEDLLSEDALLKTEIFNPSIIRNRWKQHQSSESDWQFQLWDVLMLQSWAVHEKS